MGVTKISDHIQIKIKIPNPNKESPASSKARNQDLQNQDREPKFGIWLYQRPMTMSNSIRMPNPSQEPTASSKATDQDLKDMDVLCTFKVKIESPNSDHGYMEDQ